jgi:hypothetical protein
MRWFRNDVVLAVGTLVSAWVWAQEKNPNSVCQDPSWPEYVAILGYYNQQIPQVYTPPEWIAFDKLETAAFKKHSQEAIRAWKAVPSHQGEKVFREARLRVARDTYEALESLLKAAKIQTLRRGAKGCLHSTPESSRVAVTPVDALFLGTELGQIIKQDLDRLPPTEFFELSSAGTSSRPSLVFRDTADKEIYRVRVSRAPGTDEQMRLRGESRLPGFESKLNKLIRPSLFSGSFWTPEKLDRNPLGIYVRQSERWVDESGVTHFQGDGHDHKH